MVQGFSVQGLKGLGVGIANRRTAEFRITNVEGWIRFAQSFYIK